MYFITTKRMLEVCFSAHPNIQYRTVYLYLPSIKGGIIFSQVLAMEHLHIFSTAPG